jgi:hypothetical protein
MSEKTPIVFNHTGDFRIGTGLAGAKHLQAILSVPDDTSSVHGTGILGQAVNPPLLIKSHLDGVVHALGAGPAKQVFALQGSPIPSGLVGTPVITDLLIVLDGIWGSKGTATYSYWIGSTFEEMKDVPVEVKWLLQG